MYRKKTAEGLLINKYYWLTYHEPSRSLASAPPITEIGHTSKYISYGFRLMGFEDTENIFVEGAVKPSISHNAGAKAQSEALDVARRWCLGSTCREWLR